MAKGRFISRTIAHSEQLAGVSLEADYLFGRCIPHLDREGRMSGNPELVKAIACPLRTEIPAARIGGLLRELATAGLVRWYEVDGKAALEFPGFEAHQSGLNKSREAVSKFPAYAAGHDVAQLRIASGAGPDLVRSSS